jgi:hypothetical protein
LTSFGEIANDCEQDGLDGPAALVTSRGQCWGYDYYGSFTRALYTTFQVLTGESWSEAGARPAIQFYIDRDDLPGRCIVKLTYILCEGKFNFSTAASCQRHCSNPSTCSAPASSISSQRLHGRRTANKAGTYSALASPILSSNSMADQSGLLADALRSI